MLKSENKYTLSEDRMKEEKKTITRGVRFKPSILNKLIALSVINEVPMSDYLESLVLREFDKTKGGK